MIFITVGTQLAFDRLTGIMDNWAKENPGEVLFAQTGPSSFPVRYMKHEKFVTPDVAEDLFRQADLIVSHAGMGSILTALKYRKPIIVMPRKADLGEHRNDHQIATVHRLADRPGIYVAMEEADLVRLLEGRGSLARGSGIPDYATGELIGKLRTYLENP